MIKSPDSLTHTQTQPFIVKDRDRTGNIIIIGFICLTPRPPGVPGPQPGAEHCVQ